MLHASATFKVPGAHCFCLLLGLLIFAFLSSDRKGGEQAAPAAKQTPTTATPHSKVAVAPADSSSKRRRDCSKICAHDAAAAKRLKLESHASHHHPFLPRDSGSVAAADMDDARDVIRHQFGLEVLLKHNELRLINQELAKCQVALEQLRRCHLIPYPQSCPTPEQMLDISSGRGPAVAEQPGEATPRWAPPFGVVDGPYARHYAMWLIPDPRFDGLQYEFRGGHTRLRASVGEGRTTRNGFVERGLAAKSRSIRGTSGHKLQALSNGYAQTKEKSGPCLLKRSDGSTVKLVCLDCDRDNFSSTQGFINHCRIAHRRDIKSHEEAALRCGQPVQLTDVAARMTEKKAPAVSPNSTLVHPFARQDMTDQEAYRALLSRIDESLKLYHAGKLPGVSHIPSAQPITTDRTSGLHSDTASQVPYLSQMMEARNFNGSLHELVTDAKTKVCLEDILPGEDMDDEAAHVFPFRGAPCVPKSRTPAMMHIPSRSRKSPVAQPKTGDECRSDTPLTPGLVMSRRGINAVLSDEDMKVDTNLTPQALISNNAPSLVSDDGEYDESDEGASVSGASDHLAGPVMSDVAEITLDDDHESRTLRRGCGNVTTMKLRNEAKAVTLVNPLRNGTRHGRSRRI